MVLSDIKMLVDVTNTAGNWLAMALGRAKQKRDRRAAHVLHDAIVLVASMRSYDNAFRPLLGRILTFTPTWDAERRQQTTDDIIMFLDHEEILPYFRQAATSLASYHAQGEPIGAVIPLLECASRFMDIVEADRRTKDAYRQRSRVIELLLMGRSERDAYDVREWAERKVNELDRRVLADAEIRFAELRSILLREYDLPDPGMAVDIR